MARTALAVQNVTRGGLTPAYTAANVDGHSIPNSGRELVHVKAGATPTTVTIQTPGTIDGMAVADRTVTVPASQERMIGPFPPEIYNQGGASGDQVFVDFSSVATITCGAFKV